MARNAFNENLVGFRNTLGDFSRSFMFRIDVPSWFEDNKVVSMLARSITLPAYSITPQTIPFQGMKMQVATVPEFDQGFTVDILADEKQVLRGNIMKWMSYIYDPATMEAATLSEYKKDNVTVTQLDRMGKSIMTYKFYGLFPRTCGSPTFTHEDVAPQKFQVQFAYDFFTFTKAEEAVSTLIVVPPQEIKGNEVAGIVSEGTTPGAGTDEPVQSDANKPTR